MDKRLSGCAGSVSAHFLVCSQFLNHGTYLLSIAVFLLSWCWLFCYCWSDEICMVFVDSDFFFPLFSWQMVLGSTALIELCEIISRTRDRNVTAGSDGGG